MSNVERRHYSVSFNELLEKLGFDPSEVHITRVWAEESVDYLHFHVEPGAFDGSYVDERHRVYAQIGDGPKVLVES